MSLAFTKPDHLIVVARTLNEGIEYVADSLRAVPVIVKEPSANQAGRARLALWEGLYIEIVTSEIVPSDTMLEVGMTGLNTQSLAARMRAAHGPYLAHWFARVERPRKLAQWAAQYPRRISPVRAMRHGQRDADVALDPSGAFPAWRGAGDGLLPTLIQWNDANHPTAALPETGIALKALRGFHPSPELIGEQLRWLGLDPLLTVEATLVEPSLFAEFDTPSGLRTLK